MKLTLFPLALLLAAFTLLPACDGVPSASASVSDDDPEAFVLREAMAVEAHDGIVYLRVDGETVALPAVEMFALTQVAQSAAYQAFTPEQRDIYLSGEASDDPPYGPNCYPDNNPWVFERPGGGGGDPCPPPPARTLGFDLASLFYGDYFRIGKHPGDDADWRHAAGGNVY